MKLCAIEPKELEEKILIRFAENQNDELLEDLSDYVINSQKEIERLKEDNEYLNKVNIELSSRNSKATEYIKENIYTFPAIPQGVYDLRNINLDKLLDILKGSDKE